MPLKFAPLNFIPPKFRAVKFKRRQISRRQIPRRIPRIFVAASRKILKNLAKFSKFNL